MIPLVRRAGVATDGQNGDHRIVHVFQDKKEVRQFLGLGGFMPGYSPASSGSVWWGCGVAEQWAQAARPADGAAVPFLPD